MKIESIDHIVLMVRDVEKTAEFYSKFLGKPIFQGKDQVAYQVGQTKLFLALPYHELKDNEFNKDRVGLNHIAFGLSDLEELKKLQKKLDDAGVQNSGVIIDKYGNKEFVWFDDPDGIRLEFYLRT